MCLKLLSETLHCINVIKKRFHFGDFPKQKITLIQGDSFSVLFNSVKIRHIQSDISLGEHQICLLISRPRDSGLEGVKVEFLFSYAF